MEDKELGKVSQEGPFRKSADWKSVKTIEEKVKMPIGRATTEGPIEIRRIIPVTTEVAVIGTAPLIMHKWSEKAKRMMLEKQQGKARTKADPKNPQEDFEGSIYYMQEMEAGKKRYGFPAGGFKTATVDAARHFKGLTMVTLKAAIAVIGEGPEQLVELDVAEPRMREDMVRLETGVADIRYRAEFWPWRAILRIRYLPSVLTQEALVALVDAGGFGGIGDARPSSKESKSGSFGTYEVDLSEMEEVE